MQFSLNFFGGHGKGNRVALGITVLTCRTWSQNPFLWKLVLVTELPEIHAPIFCLPTRIGEDYSSSPFHIVSIDWEQIFKTRDDSVWSRSQSGHRLGKVPFTMWMRKLFRAYPACRHGSISLDRSIETILWSIWMACLTHSSLNARFKSALYPMSSCETGFRMCIACRCWRARLWGSEDFGFRQTCPALDLCWT